MYGTKAGNLDFVNGVDSFVQTAKAHKNIQDDGNVYCPCIDCKNQKQFGNVEQIRFHLLFRGFMPNYQVWNKHGEVGETMHSVQEDRHATMEETTTPETGEWKHNNAPRRKRKERREGLYSPKRCNEPFLKLNESATNWKSVTSAFRL